MKLCSQPQGQNLTTTKSRNKIWFNKLVRGGNQIKKYDDKNIEWQVAYLIKI